jgi:hypothetical protein
MNAAAATRFARQLALPEVGPAGQERLLRARVAVVGAGLAAETAARYLAAAGVGTLRLVGDEGAWDEALRASHPEVALEHRGRPTAGAGWLDALEAADVVVRAGFDDDPMLSAAIRLGVPAVVVRGRDDGVELVSFREHGPCPHAALDVVTQAEAPEPGGAAGVVAGALAASEALHVLLGHGETPARAGRARHLRVPLDGGESIAQDIPWTPECFACGGSGSEMSFE